MFSPCAEIMSRLLRIHGGRRVAVAVEGAAVMKYSRSSHHPVSQSQGGWMGCGGKERGGGEQTPFADPSNMGILGCSDGQLTWSW